MINRDLVCEADGNWVYLGRCLASSEKAYVLMNLRSKIHTGYIFNQLSNRRVVGQRASSCLHVRQLRHKLLYLAHCFSIMALLEEKDHKGI